MTDPAPDAASSPAASSVASHRTCLIQTMVLAGLLLNVVGTAEADLVNGRFESPVIAPNPNVTYGPGCPSYLTGWCITGTSGIDLVATAWSPADGAQSISLNFLDPSAISQIVPTISGADYRISFSMAAERPADNAAVRGMDVYWGIGPGWTAVGSYTFNPFGHSNTSMGWECHSFVAPGQGSDNLRFVSTTPGPYGPALDGVCVTDLVNGSFEAPAIGNTDFTLGPGCPSYLTGWCITGTSGIDLVGAAWPPADGAQSISLNFFSPSTIYSQTPLSTVAGQTYRVSFSMAAERPADNGALRTMKVYWGSPPSPPLVGSYAFNPSGYTNSNMGWQNYSISVVGTGSDILKFESTTPGAYGPALDNIVVDCCPIYRVDPCSGFPNGTPCEVQGLTWISGTKDDLQWNPVPGAAGYKVFRGDASSLADLLTASPNCCERSSGTTITTGDILTEVPASGSLAWYLVTAVSQFNTEGPSGDATAGPRHLNSSGACP